MKPPPFEYFSPAQLPEAVQLYAGSENARVLAGGQSLMAMLNMRFIFPERLIDLNRIADLDYIREANDEIVIGAMTRQHTIQRSHLIASKLPVIPRALRYVGHIQTRNRGTIGGSLCQLDPSAELPSLATAYDAVVEAVGPNGLRKIPFSDFPAFFMTPSLEPNEILTAVRFKPWPGLVGYGFHEFSRRHGDFAIAGAITMLSTDSSLTIQRAAITLFGIAHSPVRASEAEAFLKGQRPSTALFREAAALCPGLATLDDSYGSSSYRGHVAASMVERALADSDTELRTLRASK